MSIIIEEVIDSLKRDSSVQEIGVFLHATVLRSAGFGLAYTFPKQCLGGGRHSFVAGCGGFVGQSARELAGLATSSNLVEASIGVAAINSLVELPSDGVVEKNAVDLIMEWGRGKRLAVVGHFPFVERIGHELEELWVLELNPHEGDLPASEAERVIPKADVVAISSTTLINHTLEGLLELAQGKRVVLLGPSTIMMRRLFDFGIDAICGVDISDGAKVMAHLSQGGSFRHLPGARYISICKP